MIQTIKKQGLKVALPLLLLATACGEGTPSASQFDALELDSSQGTEAVVEADASIFQELPTAEKTAPAATTQGSTLGNGIDLSKVAFADKSATKVPEPTALAGLAVAALGLGAVKRKQSV